MIAAMAVLTFIRAQDHRLMQRMSGWRPPRWFRVWMLLASRLGDGWLWCVAGVLTFLLGGPRGYVAVLENFFNQRGVGLGIRPQIPA